MDDVVRTEYPGLLAVLLPGQATHMLNDRVKRINKINLEIADWLQGRRRVEEQYAAGLRKLTQYRAPNSLSELGIFQAPWARIVESVERIAQSHHVFAERIEQDVEQPLRTYQQRRGMQNMHNISGNLVAMAKDLEDARDKAEKLSRKGNKASAQKVEAATSRLESASQQWDSQAPFIFETLQALDEARVNQLRDFLTQYQSCEADQAQRAQSNAVEALAVMIEISTEQEIRNFVQRAAAGRTAAPARASMRPSPAAGTRPISSAGASPSLLPASTGFSNLLAPAPTARSSGGGMFDDGASDEEPLPAEPKPESKLRRLSIMLGGRRRQSAQVGFGPLAPQRTGPTAFGRMGSSHGRGLSPRPSTANPPHDSGRLSALPETPNQPTHGDAAAGEANGVAEVRAAPVVDYPSLSAAGPGAGRVNGTHAPDVSHVASPLSPPSGQQTGGSPPPSTDEEGFTIRAPMSDPISEAQREAAGEDPDQHFKLNIQNAPVDEEDPQAKEAALSNVANTLKLGTATRRSSTIRGRRDVRNTVYVPPPSSSRFEGHSDAGMPAIAGSPPASSSSFSRPAPAATFASETSIAGTSDTQSVRSGNSLGSLAHAKHPDMTGPGLNSSIIETISVVFEDGVVKSASIAGEIAFVNNPWPDSETRPHEVIRINNFPTLERIGPNRIFVQNASPDQPDQFTLDTSHLARMATAFSYRVFAEDGDPSAHGLHAPLLLKPAWKPQGDKLGLLLQYQLNPSAYFTAPVTLHNVVLVARYDGKASGAQTKPSGTHLKDKHLVYWRLGDIHLTGDMQKIVCRIVGADGAALTAGYIEARWEYVAPGSETVGSGISISRLEETDKSPEDDPFADQSLPAGQNWVGVPLQKKLVSGKYEGK